MIALPNVTTPSAANASLGLAYIGPGMMSNWSFMANAMPTYSLATSGFSLPIGVGTRYSPTATSHIDVTIGNLNVTPGFTGQIGLVNVMGHIGY